MDQKITQLYRHYDINGRLLYVGISLNVLNRTAGNETAHWFLEAVRIEIDHYPSRDEALRAERAATRRENPKYNTVHQINSVMAPIKRNLDIPPIPVAAVLEHAKIEQNARIAASQDGSFTINSWCKHHKVCRAMFYKLETQGDAPETYPMGRSRRISKEANDTWFKKRATRSVTS